jgi:hypothetical protein
MSDEKAISVTVDGPFVLITYGVWELCVQAGSLAYISTELNPDRGGMRVSLEAERKRLVELTFDTKDEANRFAARVRKAALEAGQWRRG